MKVVEKKPNYLKLRTISAFWWVTAAMFGVCGTWYIVLLNAVIPIETSVTTLSCNRQKPDRGTCQLDNSNFWLSRKTQIPVSNLKSAKVSTRVQDSIKTYQILIITSSGEITFNPNQSYKLEQAQAITSAINSFVKNRLKTSLSIESAYKWFSIAGLITVSVIAVSFLCIMLLCLLQGVDTWIFEKNIDGLTIKQKRLLGKKFTQHLQQGEIEDVTVEESESWNGDNIYRLSILQVSGESIPLSQVYSSGWERKQEIRRSINIFIRTQDSPINSENLGIPFAE
ncbi:MAG: hypothetical protein KME64_15510 [Scytonematopsis contorta HA4267-MV1]|jgi:hypothetical protein|nr:hypothetical protein [Scytonematopsis contorta HA4267-MV1]